LSMCVLSMTEINGLTGVSHENADGGAERLNRPLLAIKERYAQAITGAPVLLIEHRAHLPEEGAALVGHGDVCAANVSRQAAASELDRRGVHVVHLHD
jgi:hypothetical protein